MLAPHPRLHVPAAPFDRLAQTAPAHPLLQAASAHVAGRADEFLESPIVPYDEATHNAHLIRARGMQYRVVTLIVRYFQTKEERYRAAAIEHVREMDRWEYWSWQAWRRKDPRPDFEFDLSYGENALTLAWIYDWLYHTLTPEEKRLIQDVAVRRAIKPFLAVTNNRAPAQRERRALEDSGPRPDQTYSSLSPARHEKRPSWFGRPDSNWNTVCAGGAGTLALALYDDLPEAPTVVALAEESVVPFMDFLRESHGGWPEGIGYWNYGMRYAFLYLLAHERAFGSGTNTKHALLERPETRATLRFPLHFTPNGVPCSFGDVNHWRPFAFHYAAATRYGDNDVIASLDAALTRPRHPDKPDASPFAGEGRPDAAELLLYHPGYAGQTTPPPEPQSNVALLYPTMDWAILADHFPDPTLYLSIRGGTTDVSHSHLDLLSFHCAVNDESLITNLGVSEYLDTTFGARRFELFETTPASKNTILVNGVGITQHSRVITEQVEIAGHKGFRLDASAAMGTMRDGPATTFCGRLFLLLEGQTPAALIVDRVELPYPGRVETRLHTFARTSLITHGKSMTEGGEPSIARLQGDRHALTLGFAATVPAVLRTAQPPFTTPPQWAKNPTAIRWCTQSRSHTSVTFATLLIPGQTERPLSVFLSIDEQDGILTITASVPAATTPIRVTTRLTSLP